MIARLNRRFAVRRVSAPSFSGTSSVLEQVDLLTLSTSFLNFIHFIPTKIQKGFSVHPSISLIMSTAEAEETQSAYGDGGAGGPGAPTPLSVLEVTHTQSQFRLIVLIRS